MKSFIIALVLLFIVVTVTTVAAITTDEYADRMISAVTDAENAPAENRTYEVKNVAEIWDEAKSTVCVTIHRKEATRTEGLIAALSELCEREHTDTEYFGVCRQLKEELLHIRELGIPSWRNIM